MGLFWATYNATLVYRRPGDIPEYIDWLKLK